MKEKENGKKKVNQTIHQLYCEYRDSLKCLMTAYDKKFNLFEDQENVREFIVQAENLKTLVSLYADLVRETRR